MADHTDTAKLLKYQPNRYPNLPGGEALYLTTELTRISNTLNKAVDVIKMLEARLNANGLT